MIMQELSQDEVSSVSGGVGIFQWTSHAAGIVLTGFVMRAIDTTVRGRKGIIAHKGSAAATTAATLWMLLRNRIFTGANASKICIAYSLIIPVAFIAATACAFKEID